MHANKTRNSLATHSHPRARIFVYKALLIAQLAIGLPLAAVSAQTDSAAVPDLTGIWDGGTRARPINGENMPWEPANFPVLNERALAYQQVWEEMLAKLEDARTFVDHYKQQVQEAEEEPAAISTELANISTKNPLEVQNEDNEQDNLYG